MNRFCLVLLFAVTAATLSAQEFDDSFGMEVPGSKHSVSTRSFWNNWYVSAGVLNRAAYSSQEESALSGNPFSKERNSFGFELGIGKWFTPGIGLRTQFQGLWGKQATWHDVSDTYRYMNIHEDVMFNLSNLLYGYNERRVWNFIPYAGIGFARNFSYNVNTVSYNLGIQNTWRLSRHFSVYFDVSAMLAPADFDGIAFANPKAFRMRHWDKSLHFSLGLTYRLGKKTGWEKSPNIDLLMEMNREQMNALNESLREQQEENMRLAALAGEGQEPTEKPAEPASADTVTRTQYVPQSVFFNLGSAQLVSRRELVNLKALAEFAKAQNLTVVVTGYADSRTGSAERNLELSRERAEALADELVKMGVGRERIRTVAGGGVATLSPYSYNRRAIITLEK